MNKNKCLDGLSIKKNKFTVSQGKMSLMQKDPRLRIEPKTYVLQGNSGIKYASIQP